MSSTTSSKEGAEAIYFGSDSCSSSPKSSGSSTDEYNGASNAYLEHAATSAATGADGDSYDPVSSYECGSSKGSTPNKAASVKFSSPTSDSKRIINFGSGFKIPKRPSNESAEKKGSDNDETTPQQPPAKKQKSSNDDKVPKTTPVVKKKLAKTTDAAVKSSSESATKTAASEPVKKPVKKVTKRKEKKSKWLFFKFKFSPFTSVGNFSFILEFLKIFRTEVFLDFLQFFLRN